MDWSAYTTDSYALHFLFLGIFFNFTATDVPGRLLFIFLLLTFRAHLPSHLSFLTVSVRGGLWWCVCVSVCETEVGVVWCLQDSGDCGVCSMVVTVWCVYDGDCVWCVHDGDKLSMLCLCDGVE